MKIIFTEEFINKLPQDNILALKAICNEFHNFASKYFGDEHQFYEDYFEEINDAYAFLEAFNESRNLELELSSNIYNNSDSGEIPAFIYSVFVKLTEFADKRIENMKFLQAKEKYSLAFVAFSHPSSEPTYFSGLVER